MSQIHSIRDRHRLGATISSIAREDAIDRKTVRKYVRQENFSPEPPLPSTRPSILDPYKATVIGWLAADEGRWHKQRHTASRIHVRLQEEYGFTGSYPTVQRFVLACKLSRRPEASYAELVWHPSEAQADFGEVDVYEHGVKVRRYFLVLSFPYSNHAYYQLFRGETSECVCEGLKAIFEHIGVVPTAIVFDNATGIGRRVHNQLTETMLFSQFRQHYGFDARFCNPYAGHEKGHVESKVKTIRRQCFVPEPHVIDIERYNRELLVQAEQQRQKIHYKKAILIDTLFQEELQAMRPLNRHAFDVVTYKTCRADKFGKVFTDPHHRYASLPELGGRLLVLGLRAEYVDILTEKNQLVVRHRREYGKARTDSEHPWGLLRYTIRHPRSWMNNPLRAEVDADLRSLLDAQDTSDRRKTLQLLDDLRQEHSIEQVTKAILEASRLDLDRLEDIAVLAARICDGGIDMPLLAGPDLRVYDAFLPGGQVVRV